jgi:diguanylate cyclase
MNDTSTGGGFGACNGVCRSLFDIGVPADLKWVRLADTLRNISADPATPHSTKKSIQSLLIPVFKNREFSDDTFGKLTKKIEEYRHEQCHARQSTLLANIDTLIETLDLTSNGLDTLVGDKEVGMANIEHSAKQLASTLTEGNIQEAIDRVEKLQSKIAANMDRAFTLKNELSERARHDALTRLANRRFFDERLEELAQALAEQRSDPVSLIFADIDHFKTFNDTYGHKVGDSVLAAVAGELRNSVRGEDLAARYGGEEMVALAVGLNHTQALSRAEEIRRAIEEHEFVLRGKGQSIHVTVSIGVVTVTAADTVGKEPQAIARELVENADAALYRAKNGGRNQVVSFTTL